VSVDFKKSVGLVSRKKQGKVRDQSAESGEERAGQRVIKVSRLGGVG
jgi:hypothetical protein